MKKKNLLSLFLALVMAFALAVPAFAAEPDDGDEGEIVIEPRLNYLVLDEDINNAGTGWIQPDNYKYYRVWIQNTSTTTMVVTLKYPNGTREVKTIPADPSYNNRILFESSSAAAGEYRLSFSNANGNPSGTVRVRVAEEALTLTAAQPAEAAVLTAPVMYAAFGEEGGIEPRYAYAIINNLPIRMSGYRWSTPNADFKYYQVTVHNTSSQRMRVMLTHPDGQMDEKYVAAGAKTIVFTSTNAAVGEYRINFSDGTVNPTGTVEVVVSDLPI